MDGLEARLFDADGHDRPVDLAGGRPEVGDRQLLWVDADLDDPSALDRLGDLLELDAGARRRLATDTGRAGVTRAVDRVHVTIEALEPEDPEADPTQATGGSVRLIRRELDVLVGPGVVATVHHGPVAALQRYRDALADETSLGVLDPGDLLSTIVDEVIDGYFQLIEAIERDIDRLDEAALRGRSGEDILAAIVALRQRINLVRRTLAPHRGAIAALTRPETRADEAIGTPWPGLAERLEGALSATEALREALLGTYDIHMGRAAQRANGVMQALTLLSAVLLPAVVLAGVMGMNFDIPFFADPNNFFVVVAAMILFGLGLFGFARWRHWL